jgi:calcineurin-like phosphoesterase family protein
MFPYLGKPYYCIDKIFYICYTFFMAIFFTSDQHLGHDRILELGSGRPFKSIGEHNTIIRNRWFETVTDEDTVYVMGDIAMGREFEHNLQLFFDLPGYKKFIPGNHDKIFSSTNSQQRIERYTPLYEAVGFKILPENTKTFLETSYGIQEVLLSHFPYSGDSHSELDRYAKNRYKNEGLPIIHGHTHSREVFNPNKPLEFHVGVDAHDFTPVSETVIVEWLEKLKNNGHI